MLRTMSASLDTDGLHGLVPLAATLGIRVVAASADEIRLELDWREDLCTAAGVLHGGALMSLADTAGAVCAVLNLPDGATGTTTVESKTNLLAAVRDGTVTATATPLKSGRTLIVVETEMRDTAGRLVAKTAQTQAVLRSG
jgi:1,4-dihydroxy-2-naphthoyl-CoA hydrolase